MITSYYYKGHNDDWEFEEIKFDKINLFVGTSGSGKTKCLNTIFNFSVSVLKGEPFRTGYWRISAKTKDFEYSWEYDGQDTEVKREILKRRPIDSDEDFEILVDRTDSYFIFCKSNLPKLEPDKPSITLLKKEEKIKPFYNLFMQILRRNFHDEGLREALTIQSIPLELINNLNSVNGIDKLKIQEWSLSAKMFLMKLKFPDLYDLAISTFKQVFTSIRECGFQKITNPPIGMQISGEIPLFILKEQGVKTWIPLLELSSGMQKVLLIITDILTLPEDSIYIIDEYENSLGINAIDFLPQFLLDYGEKIQFIITTHHPYLINSMPMKSWRVFHRVGSKVSIKNGEEFEKKYGKSKQKAFIQLINDPFYIGN